LSALSSAKRALAKGNFAEALALASESQSLRKSPEAAEIIGEAACALGDVAQAKSAARLLPSGRRAELVRRCLERGAAIE
jgi:thioredoxin-like negative regulator of GroEL